MKSSEVIAEEQNVQKPLAEEIPETGTQQHQPAPSVQQNPSESENGTEVIIYKQPQEIPEESNFHIIVYIFIGLINDLTAKIIFAILLININHSDKKSFDSLVLFLAIFHIWKIIFNIVFKIIYGDRIPEFRNIYIFEIILSLGYFSVFWCFYMYLNGKIDAASLPLFVIPHIILCLVRYCVGEALNTPFLPFSFLTFVESLEILYIAIKLGESSSHSDWTWVLLYFYIVCFVFLILSFMMLLALIITIGMLIFSPEIFREADSMAIMIILGGLFYIVWNGFMYYYILSGFHIMLAEGHIGPNKTFTALTPRLASVAYFMLICATITLIILLLFFFYLKDMLIQAAQQGKPSEISLQKFTKGINLGVIQQSSNYFKKKENDDEEQPEGGKNPEITTCIICCDKESDVLIRPCRHSGICKDCMIECLKRSYKCPHCKQKMTEVQWIYYDNERKKYLAKGTLKFKNGS